MSALGGSWEHLSSEELLSTPYFTLRAERLRLPDGVIKDPYYTMERPDAAIIFPLTLDDTVVLVRQYRPPLKAMELGLPAGLVEAGEEPAAAARRELAEETGYAGGEWEPLGKVASSPSLKSNYAHLFLARGVGHASPPSPDEHERLEVVELPPRKLYEMVAAGEVISSSGVAAILLALRKLKVQGPG